MGKMTWAEAGSLGAIASNAAKKQRNLARYDASPNRCRKCDKKIAYEKRRSKFCDHSCAASFNNLGVCRNDKNRSASWTHPAKRFCAFCGKKAKSKYCSRICFFDSQQRKRDEQILSGHCTQQALRTYLLRVRPNVCEICRLDSWQDKPIPLDVDHKDGDPTNHTQSNVRLLCKNCHAQTPSYGAKNKGNGRSKRRAVYQRLGYS